MQTAGEGQNFPSYSTKKSDNNHYRVTLVLVGFRQEDLDIQLEGTHLVVKGAPQQPEKEIVWLHQGLMSQAFNPSFTLADNMEASGATFINGLLHVDLTRDEPEQVTLQHIVISGRPALNS